MLTSVPGGVAVNIGSAVYSPDGTKIAYLQCDGDGGDPDLQGQGSIWVMNADGSDKRLIFNGGNGVQSADRLSWVASWAAAPKRCLARSADLREVTSDASSRHQAEGDPVLEVPGLDHLNELQIAGVFFANV